MCGRRVELMYILISAGYSSHAAPCMSSSSPIMGVLGLNVAVLEARSGRLIDSLVLESADSTAVEVVPDSRR